MTSGEGTAPFLTIDEFVAQWRPLSAAERVYAEQLLAAAARRIRRKVPGLAADDPDAKLVSFQVVRSVLESDEARASMPGLGTFTTTVGEKTNGGKLINPDALLVFTPYHWDQLGVSSKPQPRWNFPRNDY
ncbi:head-to-tail adaptor [Gordonia phage UmaThurman]|uniref:head-to-tail adaptor n=1 Tax=Gordonia phage UmaThurman TaxID=1821563 RepID=UPI00078EED9F|nr:head-to-tail adaptor [Gordonia phage UmaThurman]AMS03908.1 head-to-tail adaptor [Gordonia phage UmaThurman]QDK02222.1 head-to-tail adaptor [Gordonia phage Samba]